jgi:hypothetical protein
MAAGLPSLFVTIVLRRPSNESGAASQILMLRRGRVREKPAVNGHY